MSIFLLNKVANIICSYAIMDIPYKPHQGGHVPFVQIWRFDEGVTHQPRGEITHSQGNIESRI